MFTSNMLPTEIERYSIYSAIEVNFDYNWNCDCDKNSMETHQNYNGDFQSTKSLYERAKMNMDMLQQKVDETNDKWITEQQALHHIDNKIADQNIELME